MTIASLTEELGLEKLWEAPQKEFPAEHLDAVRIASASLAASIREDTVTAEQIDSFLQHNVSLLPDSSKQDIQEFLVCTKATLLFGEGNEAEGLKQYDRALEIKETPSAWALKGTSLLQLDRLDEAFDAFRKAYSLREEFGPQKQGYLEDLIGTWSIAALLLGLSGILEQDVPKAGKGAHEYINLLNLSKEDHLAHLVLNLAVPPQVSEELMEALAELDLMVCLLSIKDPFDRWRELTKEISKAWPKDVSAVDAIREQRE